MVKLVRKVTRRTYLKTGALSAGLALGILALGWSLASRDPGLSHLLDDFAIIACIAAIVPLGVVHYAGTRWRRAADRAIPDLLRDVVDAQLTGLSIVRAIEECSKREYGPLSSELRKVVARMSWGVPFDEAMRSFGEGVGTGLAKRVTSLLVEASRVGGDVRRVFELTSKYAKDTEEMDRERATAMRPYVIITYVAFSIFLVAIVVLHGLFIIPLVEAVKGGMGGLATVALSPKEMAVAFMHLVTIEGFFCGLVAGKLGEGSVPAGLKHSAILMAVGYLVVALLIGT